MKTKKKTSGPNDGGQYRVLIVNQILILQLLSKIISK
jgi:hypothetical protein